MGSVRKLCGCLLTGAVLFFFLSAFFFTPSAFSYTTLVSGEVGGQDWTLAGSPYRVSGEVTVAVDTVLTIEAGVTVEFEVKKSGGNPTSRIAVSGTLLAIGSSDAYITFTSSMAAGSKTTGDWDSIYFGGNTTDQSLLEYCIIEYSWRGARFDGSSATMTQCVVRKNYSYGAVSSGGGSPIITENTFSGPTSSLIYVQASNPIISNNNLSSGGGNGMYIALGSDALISGNVISGESTAIYIENNGGALFPKVYDNLLSGNNSGIKLNASKAVIRNNTISGNAVYGIWLIGSSYPLIFGNTISGNTGYGVFCTASSPTVHFNNILGNGSGGVASDYGVDASRNWWGSAGGPSGSDAGSHVLTENYLGAAVANSPPSSIAYVKLKADKTYATDFSGYVGIPDMMFIEASGGDTSAESYNWTTVIVTDEYQTDPTVSTISVDLMETGKSTGIYRAVAWTQGADYEFNLYPTDTSKGFISAAPGDKIKVSSAADPSRSTSVFAGSSCIWKLVNSPIRLAGGGYYSRRKEDNVSMSILPGVIVEGFPGSAVLLQDNNYDSIHFTAADPSPVKGDWGSVYLWQGYTGTTLRNCTVEYAARNLTCGFDVLAKIVIENCDIRNGIVGIYGSESFLKILKNNIKNNTIGLQLIYWQMYTRYNNITGNGTGEVGPMVEPAMGLVTRFSDSTDNYWGASNGPGGAGGGGGDPISGRMFFNPYSPYEFSFDSPVSVADLSLWLDKACTSLPADGVGVLDNLYIYAAGAPSGDPTKRHIARAMIVNNSTSAQISCDLIETMPNTGTYIGKIMVTSVTSDEALGFIPASPGDNLTITSLDNASLSQGIAVINHAVWRAVNSPIHVPDQVYTIYPGNFPLLDLPPSCSLSIEAGVTVEVGIEAYYSTPFLQIRGTLEAVGTPDKRIVITPLAPNPLPSDAGRIIFSGSGANRSIMKYCDVNYETSGMLCLNSSPRIENCRISNNTNYGIATAGICSPSLRGNEIFGNSTYTEMCGIYSSAASTPFVEYNYIHDNPVGIRVNNSTPVIRSNSVEANSQNGILFSGTSGAASPEVLGNDIINNSNNIFLDRGWIPFLPTVNYNNIYNGSVGYGAYINPPSSGPSLDARHNYWGSSLGPKAPDNSSGNPNSEVTLYVSYRSFETEALIPGGPVPTEESPANGSAANNRKTQISIKVTDLQGIDFVHTPPILAINSVNHVYPDGGKLTYDAVSGRLTYTTTEAYPEGLLTASLVSAEDVIGNGMREPFSWSFLVDSTSPEVSSVEVSPVFAKAGIVFATFEASDALSGIDYSRTPTVELLYPGGSAAFIQNSYGGGVWTGTVEVLPSFGNGGASIEILGVADMAGNFARATIESNKLFIDTIPPVVNVYEPSTGEGLSWGLTFNVSWGAYDPGPTGLLTANPIDIYLSTYEGAPLALITGEIGNSGSYDWAVPDEISKLCAVVVHAVDEAGNTGIGTSGVFSISPINPLVVATDPVNGATRVPVDRSLTFIRIEFSKSMNSDSISPAFSISPEANGYFTWDTSLETFTYNLSNNLQFSTTYEIQITSEAEDFEGNPLLNSPYIFSFTTVPLDLIPPVIGPVIIDGRTYSPPPPENIMSRSPEIRARITDEVGGSGVDPASMRIFIDGYVFTPEAYRYDADTGWLTYKVNQGFVTGEYAVTIEAADLNGNVATWEGDLRVKLGPVIDRVRIDGRVYVRGDIISSTPKIEARILDESGTSETVSASSIRIKAGPHVLLPGAGGYNTGLGIMNYDMRREPAALGPGTYTLTIEAQDIYGNQGLWEGAGLRVMAGRVQVVGPVLSYPTPFKASAGDRQPLTIAYKLNVAADVSIYMYDASGRIILTKKFTSGARGGQAGYNEFKWNGVTDFGNIPGNGIYVMKIVSNSKIIGTGKIVVME